MKLLVLSHMFPFTFNTVNGIFVLEQVKALAKAGVEVFVVSPKAWAPWPIKHFSKKWKAYSEIPEQDEVDGIQVYYPKFLTFPKSLLFATSGKRMYRGIKDTINNIHKEFPFDLIHAHVALPDGKAASMITEDFGCPFVVTIHGQDLQQTIFRNQACRGAIGNTFSNAHRVITVSSKLKRIGEKIFPDSEDKFVVVPNGIDPSDFQDLKSRCRNGSNRSAPSILSVSNLVKTKGIDLNIKAIEKLRGKYPDIHYVIVGDGDQRKALEELSKKVGLEKHVKFVGPVDHKTALQFMKDCDVFSMPSWKEGFGVVYLEAMACGKPVIGCKGEGIEDFVTHGENGILVTPHDVDDLVEKLDFILSNPSKAIQLGQRAQNLVINEYTWDKNAKINLEIYESILGRKILREM